MKTTEEKIRVARKQHRCEWCNEVICTGDRYVGWTQFDNVPITNRLHLECMVAFEDVDYMEFDNMNPRGCNCGWDESCTRCKERQAAASGVE